MRFFPVEKAHALVSFLVCDKLSKYACMTVKNVMCGSIKPGCVFRCVASSLWPRTFLLRGFRDDVWRDDPDAPNKTQGGKTNAKI